jgi:hypothetical protein
LDFPDYLRRAFLLPLPTSVAGKVLQSNKLPPRISARICRQLSQTLPRQLSKVRRNADAHVLGGGAKKQRRDPSGRLQRQ